MPTGMLEKYNNYTAAYVITCTCCILIVCRPDDMNAILYLRQVLRVAIGRSRGYSGGRGAG